MELFVFPTGFSYWLNWEEGRHCQPAELCPALEMFPTSTGLCEGRERKEKLPKVLLEGTAMVQKKHTQLL